MIIFEVLTTVAIRRFWLRRCIVMVRFLDYPLKIKIMPDKTRNMYQKNRRTSVYTRISRFLNSTSHAQRLILLVCILTGIQTTALAEWEGGIEGGTVLRDSGSASRLRLVLRNNKRPFSHYVYGEWIRSASIGDDLSIGYNPRFWFNDTYYAFGESSLRTVNSIGIDRDISLVGGLGGQFLNQADQSLFVEAGLGGRSIEFEDADEEFTETLGIARLGYYKIVFDSVKFDLNLSTSQSSDSVSETIGEVGLSLRVPNGVVRVAYRGRNLKSGDSETISDDDTFISFGLGF